MKSHKDLRYSGIFEIFWISFSKFLPNFGLIFGFKACTIPKKKFQVKKIISTYRNTAQSSTHFSRGIFSMWLYVWRQIFLSNIFSNDVLSMSQFVRVAFFVTFCMATFCLCLIFRVTFCYLWWHSVVVALCPITFCFLSFSPHPENLLIWNLRQKFYLTIAGTRISNIATVFLSLMTLPRYIRIQNHFRNPGNPPSTYSEQKHKQ